MIEIIVFGIILAIQFLMGIYALLVRRGLGKEYSLILGEQIYASETLEKYFNVYRKVNLNVNADIDSPAFALEEYVLLNKARMFFMDLYTHFYLIYQLELSRKEHRFKRNLYIFQNFIFFAQFVVFGLGFAFDETRWFTIAAIGMQFFVITLSFIGYMLFEFVLQDSHAVARDILNLDDWEDLHAYKLKESLKLQVFEYPLDMLYKLFLFFLPAR